MEIFKIHKNENDFTLLFMNSSIEHCTMIEDSKGVTFKLKNTSTIRIEGVKSISANESYVPNDLPDDIGMLA